MKRWRAALLLAVLCTPVFFFRLDGYGAVSNDEGFYHAVAEAMVETGNWLRLDFRGEHRPYDTFMNAPIQYWLRATLIQFFGSNYMTMRVLSAAFGAGCVLLTWWMLVERAGARAAWLGALVLLSTFQFVYLHSARTGVLEPAIAFFFALAAHCFARGLAGRHRFVGHHLCIAALVNLKLPFAVVPVAAALAYFAIDRDSRRQFPRWLTTGIAIAPFAVSWHLYQAFVIGEPVAGVFERMAGLGSGVLGSRSGALDNVLRYAHTVLYGTFPYVLLLPWAIWGTLRDRGSNRDWKVFAIFVASVFVFFAFVSKWSPWYVIPAYPLLCAFAGAWLADVTRRGGVAVWALACAIALLVWVDVGFGVNPFDSFAYAPYAHARWFEWMGIGAWIGLPLTIGILVLGGLGVSRAIRARSDLWPAIGLAMLVVSYASVRVAMPFLHIPYTSEAEQIRRDLDAAASTGANVRYPVIVTRGSPVGFEARFYFAKDHRIVPFPPEPGIKVHGYQLFPRDAKPGAVMEPRLP